jgi:hypothetical protein
MLLSAALMLLSSVGCDGGPAASKPKPTLAVEDFQKPYPPGNWRLARQHLANVVQTVSHILITHEKSQGGDQSELRSPYWVAERPAQRTREEARAHAASIAKEARAAPDRFGALARKYSDDLATNEHSGSLGTCSAAVLPPAFLDALGTMRPGETSRLVETALGFHVLYLRVTPNETRVAARRIVVAYDSTTPFSRRSEAPIERTREQAKVLAAELASEASAKPLRFEELVEEYSDDADALRGGDFGLWSSHELSARSREIEAIAALTVGEVSRPIDGFDGFSIFMRTEATERPEVAVTYLQVTAESQAAGSSAHKTPAQKMPADVRAMLRGHGERFAELQTKYCCKDTQQWSQGRGNPRVEQLVSPLDVGGISRTPFQFGESTFRFYKRIPPIAGDPKPGVTTELPHPTAPDVDSIVARMPKGEAIAVAIASMRRALGDGFGVPIDDNKKRGFSEVIQELEERMRTQPASERLATLNEARRKLRSILGEREYAEMQANVRSELTRRMMGPR